MDERKDWHAPISKQTSIPQLGVALAGRELGFAIKVKELRCQEALEAPSATEPEPATAAWQPDLECIFHETRAERAHLVDWTMRAIYLRLAFFQGVA